MTYRELRAELDKLTPEQLDLTVTFQDMESEGPDSPYISLDLGVSDEIGGVTEGHPVFYHDQDLDQM